MIKASIYILVDSFYKRIELFNDEKISITSSVQNVNDISKVYTDFTQSFTIPASKINNAIFKHWYENSNDNGFDARTRKDAYIELNNDRFRTGKIQLEKAQFKNNQIDHYQISFFGSLLSLKDLFAGRFLRDFDYSTENFVYTGSNVKTRITGQITNNVKFPLITSLNNWTYQTNGTTKENWDIHKNTHPIYHTDLFPAMRIKTIIDLIAADLGITIQGSASNNFLTSDNFNNAFLWLKNTDKFSLKQTPLKLNFQTNTSTNGTQGIFDIINDSLNYVLPEFPAYLQKSIIKLTFTVANIGFFFYVYKNGIQISKQGGISQTTQMELSVPLEDSGEYTFFLSSSSPLTFTSIYEFETRNINNGQTILNLTCTAIASQTTSTTLNIADYMPEIKAEDFFSGVLKMFNLTCYSTADNVYQIYQIENWYANGNIIDITEIDSKQIDIERVKPYKSINFKYEKCENILATEFLSRSSIAYGDLKYTLDNDGEEFSIELPFENMPFQKFTGTNLQVGYSLRFDLDAYIPKPVILYDYNSIQSCDFHFNDGSSTTNVVSYNLFGQDSLISGQVNTLNFGAQQSTFTNVIETRSLFNNYYLDYLTNIFTSKARILKLKGIFPINLLKKLQLNDRLVIRDKRYIINQFTTDLTTGEVDLELLNDFRISSTIAPPLTYYPFNVTNGSSATFSNACGLSSYPLIIYGTNATFELNNTFYSSAGVLFNGNSYFYKTSLNKYVQINNAGLVIASGVCGSEPLPTLYSFLVTNANSFSSTEACPITDYSKTLYGEQTSFYLNSVVYTNNTSPLIPFQGLNFYYHCNDGTWVQINDNGEIIQFGTCGTTPSVTEFFITSTTLTGFN